MLKTRNIKVLAIVAMTFLIAGSGVTSASASVITARAVAVADECVPFAGQDEILPTYEEQIVVPAGWQRYSWTGGPWESDLAPAFPGAPKDWTANVAGDPHEIGVEGAYYQSNGNSGNGDWFYLEATDPETEMIMTNPGQPYMEPVVCEETDSVMVSLASICTAAEDGTTSDTMYKTEVNLLVLTGDRVFRIDNKYGTTGDADITLGGVLKKTVTLTGAAYQPVILPASLGNVDGITVKYEGNEWTGTSSENKVDCTMIEEEPAVNYCNTAERPDGMSIAQWLEEGKFNGADCFTITPTLQCGSFDATVAGPMAGYTWRYLEGAGMAPNLSTGKALPATFSEDYNGGSVKITTWLEGPEKDYLVGTGLPNYWDGNGRTVTINTDCAPPGLIEITGVLVSVVDPPVCGPNNDTINIPKVDNVTFEDTKWVDNKRTITAVPDKGYVIDGQSEWIFYDDATLCPIKITGLLASVVDPPVCGPNNNVLNIPKVDNVTFEDTKWVGNKRTITAVAAKGYVIDGQSEWTFLDEATLCPVTTVAPTVALICGPTNNILTTPVVKGVVYTSNGGVGSTITITAKAAEGYVLTEGSATTWTFTDIPTAGCPEEIAFSYTPTGQLAYTGVSSTGTNGLTALAIFLMASGTALLALRTRVQSKE